MKLHQRVYGLINPGPRAMCGIPGVPRDHLADSSRQVTCLRCITKNKWLMEGIMAQREIHQAQVAMQEGRLP